MDVGEVFGRRYSCRAFGCEPLPKETIECLLDAARWAPSGGNLQPWRFVVVEGKERREALAAAALRQSFVAQAPVVVVVCAVPEESGRLYGQRGRELYCIQDTAAATQNLLLAATALGLGSCWVGSFDEAQISKVLDLPAAWRPVALVPVGLPRDQPGHRTRHSLEQVVRYAR